MEDDTPTIADRLASLESNINMLTDRVCRIRMDDFKRAVITEISEVLKEEGDRLIKKGTSSMEGFAFCRNRSSCREAIEEKIRTANDIFYRLGPENAIEMLNGFIEELRQNKGCESKECQEYAATVISEALAALNIAKRLQDRMDDMDMGESRPSAVHLSDGLPEVLSLLSNPYRLCILESLYGSEKCFTDLSIETGLRAGHLQFHLQALQEKGMVRKTPVRGVYAITVPGMTVVEALHEFDNRMCSLRSVKEDEE